MKILSFIALMCLGQGAPERAELTEFARVGAMNAVDPAIEGALGDLNISAAAVRIREEDLHYFNDGSEPLPILRWALDTPLATPKLVNQVASACEITSPAKLADTLAFQSRLLGKTVRRGLVGDPLERVKRLAAQPDVLSSVIVRFHRLAGKELAPQEAAELSNRCKTLPSELAKPLALLLCVVADAEEWSREAFRVRSNEDWQRLLATAHQPAESVEAPQDDRVGAYRAERELLTAIDDFDSRLLFAATEDLAYAVSETAPAFVVFASNAHRPLDFLLNTPAGAIWIGDGQPANPDETFLLRIDLGGDDIYAHAGANQFPNNHVSLTLDLAGDDRYEADEFNHDAFAAGACGIGMLFDLAGKDHYLCRQSGLGAGVFGIGVLYDADGDDEYSVVEFGQGAATAGAGLLVDVAGDDHYFGFTQVQGYGAPQGVGLLVDLAGKDRYVANDEDVRYPSAQSEKHNNSMAQGAGFGVRGDYREGQCLSGGVGILFDHRGDDTYSAGVFAQGVGYWFGTGMLIDMAGFDSYLGQWYVQGASAHFAAGMLFDHNGDDIYTAFMNMAQGGGHDLGIGVLVDDIGNDTYHAPSMSLGAGNASGIGWLLDRTGRDKYIPAGPTPDAAPPTNNLGWASANEAGSLRGSVPSIGIFIDLWGPDEYPEDRAGNETSWSNVVPPPEGTVLGVGRGIDLEPEESSGEEAPTSGPPEPSVG